MAETKCALPPVEVSPLIKLGRWTCLIAGIIYGLRKHRKYTKIEEAMRREEERTRPAREEYLAREKSLRDEAELEKLQRIFLGTESSEDSYSYCSTVLDDIVKTE